MHSVYPRYMCRAASAFCFSTAKISDRVQSVVSHMAAPAVHTLSGAANPNTRNHCHYFSIIGDSPSSLVWLFPEEQLTVVRVRFACNNDCSTRLSLRGVSIFAVSSIFFELQSEFRSSAHEGSWHMYGSLAISLDSAPPEVFDSPFGRRV